MSQISRIFDPLRSNYSRLSLFRLSEVRPPRYTGHLAWHGVLAIVYCTKLTLRYGHSLFRLPASAGCPKQGNFMYITAGYDVLGVVLQIKINCIAFWQGLCVFTSK